MPEPTSPTDPPDRWAGLRAVFVPKPEGPSEGELDKLRGAVNEAASLLRTYTVGYLTVALYLAVTAYNTTHEQLLVGKEITLPVVGVGVPLVGFYLLAPAMFVVLHGNLLYHLEALARRVRRFAKRAAALEPAAAREDARLLLVPFQFVEWRAGADADRGHRRAVSDLATWALYFVFGPAVLLVLQLGFLPYQHALVTPWHVLCLAADGALAWRAWGELRDPGDAPAAPGARWPDYLARATTAIAVLASLGLWADVHTANRFSRIEVPIGSTIMAEVPSAERLGAYRQEVLEKNKGLSVAEAEVEALRQHAKSIDLANRNLRNAVLWGARMMGADLCGARLQGAGLGGAQLQGAYLSKAELQGAVLNTARLQGAVLNTARLQGAVLTGAQLQDADLRGARLQGADLRWAELFLVKTNAETDLSHVDLRQTGAAPLLPKARTQLKAGIERAIAEPELRARVLHRLEPVLHEPPPAWQPEALPAERRRDTIVSADAPGPIRALAGHAALRSPGDDKRYGEALAGEHAGLACGLKDDRVASRLVQRMKVLDEGAYLPDLDRHIRARCPDLIAKLDADTQKVLTDAAAKTADTGTAGGASQAPALATAIRR